MVHRLTISGMHCHHCVRAVQDALSSVEGVDEVIRVEVGSAQISTSGVRGEAVAKALSDEGYALVDMSES